jgi:hypothetical protein
MKDFRFQILDLKLSAAERGGTCFCTSWTRGSASLRPPFLTVQVKQSLDARRKRVIPRRGDAEGPRKPSHCQRNVSSLAQISMGAPSLSWQLGMTEEMNMP